MYKDKEKEKLWHKNHPHYCRDYRRTHPESRLKQSIYYKKWYKKNGRKRKAKKDG